MNTSIGALIKLFSLINVFLTVILKRTCFLEDRGPGEFYYQVALSDERQIWNLNIKQDGSVCTTQEVGVHVTNQILLKKMIAHIYRHSL